jgi:ElaA protein
MKWIFKTYNELSKDELYSILRLRAEVFVLEQDCPYQDVDNKDQKAFHVLAVDNKEVVAYARVFRSGDYFQEASIGRVVTKPSHRGTGLGQDLMQKTIDFIEKSPVSKPIRISAQTYLLKFYESYGFKKTGIEYMEDGIPHIGMLLL